MKQHKYKITQIGWLLALTLFLSLLWVPMTALADLPPRPTPLTAKTDDKDDDKDDAPIGAHIRLSSHNSGSWAVVQWLGSDGNWHDVEGWRGSYQGGTTWWVAAKDFGTGPFRWVVYNSPGGTMIGQSESFNLPTEANQVLPVFAASTP